MRNGRGVSSAAGSFDALLNVLMTANTFTQHHFKSSAAGRKQAGDVRRIVMRKDHLCADAIDRHSGRVFISVAGRAHIGRQQPKTASISRHRHCACRLHSGMAGNTTADKFFSARCIGDMKKIVGAMLLSRRHGIDTISSLKCSRCITVD